MRKNFLLLVSLLFLGCGFYSFSGSPLTGIKTIGIPVFENQTLEYGISESLTDTLINLFVRDNTLKMTNEKKADSVLKGTILKYERGAYTFDANESVKEYKVRIFVDVSFEDKKHKKTLWEQKNMEGWGVYSVVAIPTSSGADSIETEDMGKARAIKKLAEDILNKTVKGW